MTGLFLMHTRTITYLSTLVPSIFLGVVSPYTAKLMICSLHTSGKTIGTLYALSTFGSIIGTLITSFYLITLAGVNALIMGQGVLLIILSVPLSLMNLRCSIEQTRPFNGTMSDTQ